MVEYNENNFSKAKEADYLTDFFSTTFWNKFWANDRVFPCRPYIHCKNAFLIDKKIKDNLKDKSIFESMYIEKNNQLFRAEHDVKRKLSLSHNVIT